MKAWSESGLDVTFVMTIYNEGWILDKIASHVANEMESRGLLTSKYFLYGGNKLHHTFPPTDVAFFMHYSNYFHLVKKLRNRVNKFCVVWYTHFDKKHGIDLESFVKLCNEYDTKVLCPCTSNENDLVAAGIKPENVTTILGGFDEQLLSTEGPRHANKVAFVSACYERKRPDLLLEVAQKCPELEFNIIGPRAEDVDNVNIVWSQSSYAKAIADQDNVNLHEAAYEHYPDLMLQNSKYLMLSDFEGGPIGLIEAMALNLTPVATDTGFVRDLLTDDLERNLLNVSPEVGEVQAALYDQTMAVSAREKVRGASWKMFARNIFKYLYMENPEFSTYLTYHTLNSASSKIDNDIFFRFLGVERKMRMTGELKTAEQLCALLASNFVLTELQENVLKSRISLNRSYKNSIHSEKIVQCS